jgi:hypothetical protein
MLVRMKPRRYRITVRGRLSERFADAFDGATLEAGRSETHVVTGLIDQAQLHGLLERVRDFGLELRELQEVDR